MSKAIQRMNWNNDNNPPIFLDVWMSGLVLADVYLKEFSSTELQFDTLSEQEKV